MPAQMCTSAPICGKALAVEHDGRLYSCDHFVHPEYELGRIDEVHEGDLAFSRRQVEFGTAKHDRLPTYCRECPSLKLCWGECPKNRLLRTPDGDGGLNFLCEGLKAFTPAWSATCQPSGSASDDDDARKETCLDPARSVPQDPARPRQHLTRTCLAAAVAALVGATALPAAAQPKRPNILVIMSDDVGPTNVGLYSHGMMVPTPNIDRIGREGILFTDHYAHPSSTAGRAAFITGQLPIRTGLTTVGLPGSPIGIDARDPTLAELLKPWATGPASSARTTSATATATCRLCTASTSSSATLPPEYRGGTRAAHVAQRARFQPALPAARVLDCVATDVDDRREDARFGAMGKQRCTDTGALTSKRMETVDEEFLARTQQFITRSAQASSPSSPG